MLLIALPSLIGGVFGYTAGSSKKLFPLAFFGAIAAMIYWASTLLPMHIIVNETMSKGIVSTLTRLYEKSPEGLTFAPAGFIGGFIISKLIAFIKAASKNESQKAKKQRIYTEHKMREFD